jgi:hypothetical protein
VRAAIERRTQAMARWIQVTTLLFTGLAMVMGVQLVVPLLSHVHIRFGTEGTPLVGAVTTSVHHYLAIHTAGMALSPRQGYSVWLASGVGLLVLATITRSVAARGTWTAWGLASIAMVWSGSTAASRPVAAAIAAIGWGLASIAALHGIGRRTKTTTINLTNEITPPVETGTATPVDSA